ncbi:hypothetical protein [Staphylococcus devriesei]|uniref:hypothetical protein n=1 Tax=Staphylococcus devriesei TaxID=586733 RepID=UPI001300B12C|nr:hypothetical protein [Staphylococcus devriesei]
MKIFIDNENGIVLVGYRPDYYSTDLLETVAQKLRGVYSFHEIVLIPNLEVTNL